MIDLILDFKNRCNIFKNIGQDYSLTEREVHCITLVDEEGLLSSKSLSASMHLSPSRGSRIITRLMDKGFLSSQKDDEDRRSILISLTEEGGACMESIRREKAKCEKLLLGNLSAEEIRIVEQGFKILLRSMD